MSLNAGSKEGDGDKAPSIHSHFAIGKAGGGGGRGDPSGKTRSVRAYLGERFPFPGGNARFPPWMLGCPPMA